MNWANVKVEIIGDDGIPVTCMLDGNTDCAIIQFGTEDDYWEMSEILHITESGADLCSSGPCEFTFKISDIRSGLNLQGNNTVIVE